MHLTVPSAKVRPSLGKMTYKEFLERLDDHTHAEWVNGEVVMMAPVGDEHQRVDLFLLRLIAEYVEDNELGEVRFEPFQMKTGPDLPGRSPDVFFVAKRNAKRIKRTYLQGPADMVVEVISPDSRGLDRGHKYFEYEQGGVKEYWLIDPERKKAEFYELGRDRIFQLAETPDGVYHSKVLKGLWLKTEWLWRKPLPTLRWVIKQWGIG
jgi:Uma2 family endonuclease